MTVKSETESNDLINNKDESLLRHVDDYLTNADRARFAIGYFLFAGLAPLAKKLDSLKEVRLLIGHTSNQNSIEQLAEAHRELQLIQEATESQRYPKRSAVRGMELETADNIRSGIGLMEQTDAADNAISTLTRMIEEGRLKVRVHTKGRLRARAYVFDYPSSGNETGIGIVGSSNLTLASVTQNSDLDIVVRGDDNHAALTRWFDDLWKESRGFETRMMRELENSWAGFAASPYDVYMKSLYTLLQTRLEDESSNNVLWDDDITRKLADFQLVAVEHAVQVIRNHGGVFVADVVGLGKSFVGAAIVKHFERTHRCRPLIVCPASLVGMWERYSEVYHLNAKVLSAGKLREDQEGGTNFLMEDEMYNSRDFVLIDESHNFRHSNTQRYRLMEEFLSDGKRCCFLTATPRNKSAWDVYAQLKLFHQNDKTDIPVNPPNLHDYFRGVEGGTHRLHDLLANILIRRTRRDVLKWYGYDADTDERIDPAHFEDYRSGSKRAYVRVAGRKQFFPNRELETIEYSIDEAYQGLYQEVRQHLGGVRSEHGDAPEQEELTYARYGLWNYLLPDKREDERYVNLQRAGFSLRGLMRVLLFKRIESSVHAFRETVGRLLKNHQRFRLALNEGVIPAGEKAQDVLNDPNESDEQDLIDSLRLASERYSATDFDLPRLLAHIDHDTAILERLLKIVAPITPDEDAKLQTLIAVLKRPDLSGGKCLIFSQYADTARYIHENLVAVTGRDDIDVVCSSDNNKLRAVGRFAPKANPEYSRRTGESELNILVATDVLSEGLNLQDANRIVNYDLHWNPVRLIQRFGRIDRIGSEHESVYGFNFLPELGIERQLGLRRILESRIREIHETIGEDAAILDPSEQLNENAIYAIYEQRGGVPDDIEDDETTAFDLNDATEMFRQLRREDPAEYERIAALPDGIRSTMQSDNGQVFVHCQAGRFQKLYLVDAAGDVLSQDVTVVLSHIRCTADAQGRRPPAGHNVSVERVKRMFSEEVKQRQAERHHTTSLGYGQRYVAQELRQLFSSTADEDKKARLNILERAFRGSLPASVLRDLNRIRRNKATGNDLYSLLVDIYNHHGLRDRIRDSQQPDETNHPAKVVCSGALTLT